MGGASSIVFFGGMILWNVWKVHRFANDIESKVGGTIKSAEKYIHEKFQKVEPYLEMVGINKGVLKQIKDEFMNQPNTLDAALSETGSVQKILKDCEHVDEKYIPDVLEILRGVRDMTGLRGYVRDLKHNAEDCIEDLKD